MKLSRTLRDESGAMLVLIALLLVAFLGTFALAVDVGLWLNTKAEAQRAADAAALAGASVWMEAGLGEVEAEARARDYAARNYVGHTVIDPYDSDQFAVTVFPVEQKVRVTIRGGTSALFSRLLGRTVLGVGATAEARVMGGIAVKCVKPWALPDQWADDGDARYEGERYQQFDPSDPFDQNSTGWGTPNEISSLNTSFGAEVMLVHASPDSAVVPSIALPFDMPLDTLMDAGVCKNVPGGEQAAALYSRNICGCNQNDVVIDGSASYPILTSTTAKQGIVNNNIKDILASDPNARWNPDANGYDADNPWASEPVIDSDYEFWMDSPRVFRVALFDPSQLADFVPGGNNTVKFNNIALFFLEGRVMEQGNLEGVRGRFIGYPPPASRQGITTSMPKILQLVY